MQTRYITLFALLGLAACVAPPPPPATKIVSAPPLLASPPPQPLTGDWNDWPFTPGNWTYRRDGRNSIAQFGAPGRNATVNFRCDAQNRRVTLSREASPREASAPSARMVIHTSSMTKTVVATPSDAHPFYLGADIAATAPILDAMAFSRGRVLVDVEGQQPVILPTWAEIARIVEDCR
ncbi:hypothetical protein [Sphingorhabdus sp. EL138]|uniref:hypothetical protein n=1 Tax=Sphingorhabdus sp. EL138 TaxID=2073156 RepID=UPI0025F46A3D|nr:hypothetical protein [Sphingorhabdus sp. EL138]